MDNNPLCKNCQLYDKKTRICGVVIPLTQEMQEALEVQTNKLQLRPDPEDVCFFSQELRALNKDKMEVERFKIEVQQIKMWVEDPKTGKHGTEGTVRIEYPVGSSLDAILRKEENED